MEKTEELQNLSPFPNIEVKSRRMSWAGHVECMGQR
jgi:hypothetical protein